jgi:hypothetical protein
VYLRDAYALDRAESLLEIPLDSITAERLQKEYAREELPEW